MFFDHHTQAAFGHLGWIDGGGLWTWDAATGQERRIPVPAARYVRIDHHAEGIVRLTWIDGQTTVVSLRACATPDREQARLTFGDRGYRFTGEASIWGEAFSLLFGDRLRLVDGRAQTVTVLDMSWFNDEVYDRGYQAPVDSLWLPDLGRVIVSVQRSSRLVEVDVAANAPIGFIDLADRGGNPRLARLSGNRFVASDYDVICLVDGQSGAVCSSPVLQPPLPPNTHQFIGDYAVHGDRCAVARPFSGDVLLLDIEGFATRDSIQVGGQPLEVCFTSESAFVTRDWKTGIVRTGTFR